MAERHIVAIGGSDAGISAACVPANSTPPPSSPWWSPTSPSAAVILVMGDWAVGQGKLLWSTST
jgi:hypothetical protein